ncbi:MAG: Flp family type IVb pilin [Alphaproteobacteria bacterium]|nr:MAG: Flp family type IVb pilin [Alphaproteobacteria bacterium]
MRGLLRDERGATMIEYLLLLSLIAAVIIGAFTNMADNAGDMYNMIASTVA